MTEIQYRHKPLTDQMKFLSAKGNCPGASIPSMLTPQSSASLNGHNGQSQSHYDKPMSPALAAALSSPQSSMTSMTDYVKTMTVGGGNSSNRISSALVTPKNILIALAVASALLLLLFLGQRAQQKKWTGKMEIVSHNLKQIGEQQQLLLKAQQSQANMAQNASLRVDQLRQGVAQDVHQAMSTIVPQLTAVVATVPRLQSSPNPLAVAVLPVQQIGTINQDTSSGQGQEQNTQGNQGVCKNDGSGGCLDFKRRQAYNPNGSNLGFSTDLGSPPSVVTGGLAALSSLGLSGLDRLTNGFTNQDRNNGYRERGGDDNYNNDSNSSNGHYSSGDSSKQFTLAPLLQTSTQNHTGQLHPSMFFSGKLPKLGSASQSTSSARPL